MIALSNDSKFSNYHIVYSSDKNNVHNLKTEVFHTKNFMKKHLQEKKLLLMKNKARYVRIYVNGQDANSKG